MTLDEAIKRVDTWLTEEGKRALKQEAEVDRTTRLAIETVLRIALDKTDPTDDDMDTTRPTEVERAGYDGSN